MLDKLSGPAAKADKALEGLERELKSTDKALRALNTTAKQVKLNQALGLDVTKQQRANSKAVMDGIRVQRLRIGMQRDETRAARSLALEQQKGLGFFAQLRSALSPVQAARHGVEQLHESLSRAARSGGLFRSAMSGIGSMVGTVATGAAAAGVGLAGLGAAFVVSTARSADFGEQQRRILQTRFGAVEGARQYEILLEYSNRFGTSIEDTMQRFQTLNRQGFTAPQTETVMQAAEDIRAAMGNEAAEGVLKGITDMMGKGTAQMEELKGQIAERGISLSAILGEIGHARGGKSADEARAMVSQGQITGMEATAAVLRVVQRDFSHGGPLGTARMEQVANTLGGKIDLIKARWELFKTRVGATDAFAPVTRFLGRIGDMMDGNTESGRHFQQVMNDTFKDLFGDLDKQDPAKTIRDLAVALRDAGKGAAAAFGWVLGLGKAIAFVVSGYQALSNLLSGDTNKIGVGGGNSTPDYLRGARTGGPTNDEILLQRADAVAQGTERQFDVDMRRRLGIQEPVAPTAPTTGGGVSPTVPVARVNTLNAPQSVRVGDINISVEGVADGTTAQDIGQQVREHINRELSNAHASQGGAG